MKLLNAFHRRAHLRPSLEISPAEAECLTLNQLMQRPCLYTRRLAHPGSIAAFVEAGTIEVARQFINTKLDIQHREVFAASASLTDRMLLAEPALVMKAQRALGHIGSALHIHTPRAA